MADEDEVDVLGDFNLENLFSKDDGRLASCYDGNVLGSQGSELLHCDYGITQQWLLETATQPCWDTASDDSKTLHPDDRQQFGFSAHLSTTDSSSASSPRIDNDSWSDKEKALLEKGLELFGCSWIRLSQFIGTKSSHQVKSYIRSHLRHLGPASENCSQMPFSRESGICSTGVLGFTELIDDMQIPASMEEVIAVVSTAKPTVPPVPRRNVATNSSVQQGSTVMCSGELKKKVNVHNEAISRGKNRRVRPRVVSRLHATKRPSKVNRRPGRKTGFSCNVRRSNTDSYRMGKMKQRPGAHVKDFEEKDLSGVTCPSGRVGIMISKGEEVVRIKKESSYDSDDIEIEIEESVDDVNVPCPSTASSPLVNNIDLVASRTSEASMNESRVTVTELQRDCSGKMDIRSLSGDDMGDTEVESTEKTVCGLDIEIPSKQCENTHNYVLVSNENDFKPDSKQRTSEFSAPKEYSEGREGGKGNSCSVALSHQDILESIFNLPPPTEELILNAKSITEEEKVIHAEFFEGRSAKTPKRYLKIRNHILDCWRHSRPIYVTKTSVRMGLKNCGDVNCIGRIHAYLEQIGAINFGCEQARYARPLYLMSNSGGCESIVVSAGGQGREKLSKEQLAAQHQARIDAMRPRKKKHIQDSWFPLAGEGGYTITHSEDGEAIHTTVVIPDSHKNTVKVHTAKPEPIKLIYCNKFTESKPLDIVTFTPEKLISLQDKHLSWKQNCKLKRTNLGTAPYSVELHIEPLLVMDIHAHSSHSEVIGLLGGSYDPKRLVLQIWRAIACRSSSSGIHCDMCPVSQTEASERLHDEGLEVVGWYHSHPTFIPNPSLQDLDTQSHLQHWFAKTASAPLVGFILSPYCPTSKTSASEYRCLIVEPNDELTNIPYQLTVEVISNELNTSILLRRMDAIFSLHEESSEAVVDFNTEFSSEPPLTYLEKCVESARQHLRSCLPAVAEEVEDCILRSVLQACNTLIVLKQTKNEVFAEKNE